MKTPDLQPTDDGLRLTGSRAVKSVTETSQLTGSSLAHLQPPAGLPLVSIIIPCYNAERYVAEAIQSALDQTYSNCEVIVIDDGSTDGGLEVIKGFGDKIRWDSGPNRGGCAARNRGLAIAQGEWIQFLDADDLISAEKIEAQVAAGLVSGAATFTRWSNFVDVLTPAISSQSHLWRDFAIPAEFLKCLFRSSPSYLPLHAWLLPRSTVDLAGEWNEELVAAQDIDYLGRVVLQSERVEFVSVGHAYYRQANQTSVSRKKSIKAVKSRIRAIRELAEILINKDRGLDAREVMAARLALHALEAYELDFRLGIMTLKAAVLLDRNPFANNPSWFLRVLGRYFGATPALVARHFVLSILRR